MSPPAAPPEAPAYRLTVEQVRLETASARTLRLGLPPGATLRFQPGQFMLVSSLEEPARKLAFSLASSPLEAGWVEVTVGSGGGTGRPLLEAREGDVLEARGPYGRFTLDERAPESVFLFGGTGAAPLRSMLRYALDKSLPMRLNALGSFRTPADVLYRSEWAEFASRGARVHLSVTRLEAGADAAWTGGRGRLTPATVASIVPGWRGAVHYLCGPERMVADLTEGLAAMGVPREAIRCERRGEY